MDNYLGNTFYKTGILSELYNTKSVNSSYKSAGNTNENFYKINKNEKEKKILFKVKIIFKQYQLQLLEQKLMSENSKDNENENDITEIEIYNTDTIRDLIKKYCEIKKITSNNLYLTKKDSKKIKNNLTINQAKIENNETLYIVEGNENDTNIDEEKEIKFNINYQGKSYSISGFKNDLLLDCVESVIKDNVEKNLFFIYCDKIIDKNKSLEELNIKNGSVVKFGELK